MSFDFDVTHPGDTDAVAAFPANERAHRLAVSQSVAIEHDVATGHHKIGVGVTATRNAITDWVVGSLWLNTTTTPAVLQRVVSVGPVVWESIRAGGSLIATQRITATGTVTLNAATVLCDLILVGGGGGGGGAAITGAGQNSAGVGGHAGEIRYKYGIAAASVTGQTATIGAAGTAVLAANGTAGGDTTLASITAAGGPLGTVGSAFSGAFFAVQPQAIATGSGGDLSTGSFAGPPALYLGAHAVGGNGGSNEYGAGGPAPADGSNGNAGSGHGAGGSGCSALASASIGRIGGVGTAGLIIIREYT